MSNVQLSFNNAEGLLVTHYKESVRKFLKTVVVFDDQAFNQTVSLEASELVIPESFIGDLGFNELAPTQDFYESIYNDEEVKVADEDHQLDGPGLVKLFASHGIVCSIIEPVSHDGVDSIVSEIVTISSAADVLVLDWELRKGDYTATICAIQEIVSADNAQGGRLRFVVIYTAARVRDVVRALRGKFGGGFSQSGHLCRIEHACIAILNKPSVAHDNGVELSALPNKIFDLHSQFSSGLLPAAALSAIGTIRNHTHQILGQFENKLDAAFITHRALIPKADDAETHLIELVADTLQHVMLAEGVRASLSNELCAARLLELHQGDIDDESIGVIKECISSFGLDKLNAMRGALGVDAQERHPQKKIISRFYNNEHDSELARKGMAFLHDFSRSHMHKISLQHPPRISLGTVVSIENDGSFDYYVCIQPRCDSVRFEGVRGFPFMRLSPNSTTPNIHFFWSDQYRSTRISEHLYDLTVFDFGSRAVVTDVVQAEFDVAKGSWFFSPIELGPIYWVGDLRKEKAQRLVSKIASRLHLPGINEYELTRQD
ncbi:response regulator receiver domain [Pseudomonas alliivorans]|nr:response regulator receiver domain [Pseudomonas alliivorans]